MNLTRHDPSGRFQYNKARLRKARQNGMALRKLSWGCGTERSLKVSFDLSGHRFEMTRYVIEVKRLWLCHQRVL
jgi:hypothetical protein